MNNVTTLEQFDKLNRFAQQTPCGITDCDGEMYEGNVEPSDWHHRVLMRKCDNGIIEVEVARKPDGTYEGDIVFGGNGTMTAAELRSAADQYEAFPAWLRAIADDIDTRNA